MTTRRTLGRFAAAYGFLLLCIPAALLSERAHASWWEGYGEWPAAAALPVSLPRAIAHRLIDLFAFHALPGVILALALAVFAATFAVPLGALARGAARRRVLAGLPDPLQPIRQWSVAHPAWTRALTVLPALLVAAFTSEVTYRGMFGSDVSEIFASGPVWGITAVISTVALTAIARRGAAALLAPNDAEAVAQIALDASEITFDAVAVTRESIAAVVAMMALTVAVVAVPLVAHLPDAGWVKGVAAAYAAVALGGAWLFRHASKIRVGVDGVFVSGTSRTRFFSYREMDEARIDGNDVVLVGQGRDLLRLQLHGEHATRRDAIAARIGDAVARTRDRAEARAVDLAASASAEDLARVVSGGAGYRAASLSRDELWTLVEGPTVDAATRAAAARALARTGANASGRIRVAAESCADPRARVALAAVAEDEESDEDPSEERAPARLASG